MSLPFPDLGWVWRVALIVGMLALPGALRAQAGDSLLVEVRLAGVGRLMLMAEPFGESLRLPTAPVFELAGRRDAPVAAATLEDLEDLLGVSIVWSPRQLLVTLQDPFATLPANRARVDRLRAEAGGRSGSEVPGRYFGWFGGVTLDDRREALLDLGYSVGRAQARISHSTISGTAWSASANPVRPLWLSYSQRSTGSPLLRARVVVDDGWISADYRNREFGLDGAVSLGPVVIYASSHDRFAVTWRGAVDVQVGHSGERSAVRVSFGPVDPSPLSVPMVF